MLSKVWQGVNKQGKSRASNKQQGKARGNTNKVTTRGQGNVSKGGGNKGKGARHKSARGLLCCVACNKPSSFCKQGKPSPSTRQACQARELPSSQRAEERWCERVDEDGERPVPETGSCPSQNQLAQARGQELQAQGGGGNVRSGKGKG